MTPWHERDFVILDTETSGVKVARDRVVSATVGLVPSVGEPLITDYLINPGVPMPAEASAVNGFTDEFLQANGRAPHEVLTEIVAALLVHLTPGEGRAPGVLVAYNVPFDLTILDRECRRHALPTLHEELERVEVPLLVVDPFVIDKAVNPFVKGKGQRKLTPTCARYGITLENAHDAKADAVATGQLARVLHLPRETDDSRTKSRRLQLADMSIEDLQRFQRMWRERDQKSLAEWFRGNGDGEIADDIVRESPFWPYIPFGALPID